MRWSETVLLAGAAILLIRLVVGSLYKSTRSIPGPFLAHYTRLWYLAKVYKGQFHRDNIKLHQKYGPIVRYGPDEFSVADPASIKEIYGHGKEFDKARWYEAFALPGEALLFPEQNIKVHAQMRRKFQSAYTMSSIVHYEAFADKAIQVFCQRLDEMAEAKSQLVDMGWWFLCYAGDAIALITFSEPYGFLERGEDCGLLMHAMHRNLAYAAVVGIYYRIHPFLTAVLNFLARIGLMAATGRVILRNFVASAVTHRQKLRSNGEHVPAPVEDENAPKDFMDKFLDANEKDPTHFAMRDVFMGLASNVVAGADTTAASLSSILYHLLKNPSTMVALRKEVDELWAKGKLSSPVTFREAQGMPYLQAVIQEGLRISPATGLPLVRVVPPGGARVAGHFIPEGASVGVNPWVFHYNTDIYGDDAAQFRPERWIDCEKDRLSVMQRYWMPFGLGSRTCIGKNISMLEMCKVLPEILRKFDFELSPELKDNEWKTVNHWFVVPKNFKVAVTRRNI